MRLNLARTLPRSAANGPGERFVLWVQGCPLACPGCWNPDTWAFERRDLRSVEDLAAVILATEGIEGVTFTGGEPFAQARALTALAERVRTAGLSVFVFTGYGLDELTRPEHLALLTVTDVVVAGRYIESKRATGLAWRGSANQRVHFLSDRHGPGDMNEVAEVEFHVDSDGTLTVTGFPDAELLAFAVLWAGANLLSAVLALSAAAFYVGIYTLWLKRTSTQNIVIGGAAGAVPVLVGWSAVTNSLGWAPFVLFVAMFLWTPPHFWALAVKYIDDYRAAGVPMLPSVAPLVDAVRQMTWYTVAMVVSTLVLVPIADLGWIYGVTAVVLGVVFIAGTIGLGRHPSAAASMRLFSYSITYVTLLFGAMTLDVLVTHGI